MRPTIQLARYLIAGAAANLLVLALYYTSTLWGGLEPKLALTLASSFGFVFSYLANRGWAFRYTGGHIASAARFGMGYLCSFSIQLAILHLGVDWFGLPHQGVVLFGLISATAFFFLLQRFWVFPTGRRSEPVQAGMGQ